MGGVLLGRGGETAHGRLRGRLGVEAVSISNIDDCRDVAPTTLGQSTLLWDPGPYFRIDSLFRDSYGLPTRLSGIHVFNFEVLVCAGFGRKASAGGPKFGARAVGHF